MPLYEYICDRCGRRFDVQQRFDAPPILTCPAGHRPVHRAVSHPAVHFRGKGFDVTDNHRATNAASR